MQVKLMSWTNIRGSFVICKKARLLKVNNLKEMDSD